MSNKTRQPGQIPLALPVEEARQRDDLIVSPANELAVEFVDNWPNWPGAVTILAGPTGSGKSHIGSVWANECHAFTLKGVDLRELDPGLLKGKNLLIEDLGKDDLSGGVANETALFHLINMARQEKTHILITARTWPQSWGVKLPDLLSRLRATQIVELHEPDDMLLSQVIFKLFADRQLNVDLSVINYLVVRMERSLGAANQIVQWMDHHSLASSRRITRNLAAEALKALDMA